MATYSNPGVDPRLAQKFVLTDDQGTIVPMSGGTVPVSGSITVGAASGSLTDRSSTITLGGTAQQAMAANVNRKYLFIQNVDSVNLWFNFTTTAVQLQPSLELLPGQAFVMDSFVSPEVISVIGANTGQKFTAKEA